MTQRRGTVPPTVDRLLFALAVVLSGFVLFLPSAPGPPLFTHADLVVHLAVFAALAWTGLRALRAPAAVVGALVAYAGGSELVQHLFLPGRSGSLTDIGADLVGVAVGGLVWRGTAARRTR